MRQNLIAILISLFLSACNSQELLGKKLKEFAISNHDSTLYIMTSSGQLSEAYELLKDSIHFEVTTDSAGIISYVQTNDRRFKTPDGIGVGQAFATIPNATSNAIIDEAGWAKSLRLQSGWFAAFDLSMPIEDTSKIQFLYIKSERP